MLAIPTLKEPFQKLLETQILPQFGQFIRKITVIESVEFVNAFYSLVLVLKNQEVADKFYSAFNGRYFRDDVIETLETDLGLQNEIMHTIYLSELMQVIEIRTFDMNLELKSR